jgi:3-phosphoshikimate 1-carboxyvinyltransferase
MIEIEAPHTFINTVITIAGSKSISNRLLMIKQMLEPKLLVSNLSNSEDTLLLHEALKRITNKDSAIIDVNHAGTDLRFLTAYLAITEGEWILTGSSRLKERPIQELVNALKLLGADITYTEKENFPPLRIKGKKLRGGQVEINAGISSQFISALLLIAPAFEKGLTLKLKGKVVSRPYITMTLSLLREIGVQITESPENIHVFPYQSKSQHQHLTIESDWSSASYYFSICALAKNAHIELKQFKKEGLQADSVLPNIYKDLGVKTEFLNNSLLLSSIPTQIKEFNFDCSACPDIAQTIAVTCFGLGIDCTLRGLSTLKLKETDRLLALKTELEKFGAVVEIGSDCLEIKTRNIKPGTSNQKLPSIETYHDHRMAMSFVPLALKFEKLRIMDPSVVNKSYPSFWEDLKSLGFNVNLTP